MEGRENEERKWNLYSKAESITVSIGGNVHGVMPYLDNFGSNYMDLISLQNIQANDDQNGRRHSQVIQDKVSDVFKEDEVCGKKA